MDEIEFAPLWAVLEQQEQRRRRLEGRLDENLTAARELMGVAMAEPVVTGSTGQKRAHPGFAAAAACDATAVAIFKTLSEGDAEARETVYNLVRAARRGEVSVTLSAEDQARLWPPEPCRSEGGETARDHRAVSQRVPTA